MTRLALTGGAYQARSVIASAQRCLNLYAEQMPQAQGEPATFAYHPTPGLRLLGTLPHGPIRGIKQVTTGGIYVVAGDTVYLVNPADWSGTSLGTITTMRPYPVSMQDNGNTLVIVDGTAGGWTVDLPSHAFAAISEDAFYGADKVDFLDTYFLFNKPNTPQFYSSDSLSTTFDPLWFANKESFSDILVTLAVSKREIWLLGDRTTEIWSNVGDQDFPFAEVASVFINHGCRAKYSAAVYDDAIYWLSGDRAGQGIVMAGSGYQAKPISTQAIEAELTTYPRIDDAIGFVYSLAGHVFYVLTFPAADRTWVYDIRSGQWHEWLWIDDNGVEHRHRANCAYACNGIVVAGDRENGNLYAVELSALTDAGQPIKRQRSYPHLINDSDRVFYRQFTADIESGNPGASASLQGRLLLHSTFTAADGTPIESYANPADTGSWTTVVGGGVIEDNAMMGGAGSTPRYQASAVLTSPDYEVRFSAVPRDYAVVPASGSVYAIGRTVAGTAGGAAGYKLSVLADGTQYRLKLEVLGGSSTTVAMGTIPSGVFQLTLAMTGNQIVARASRSTSGLFLRNDATWAAGLANAITMTDSTYTLPGVVQIGGAW